MPKATVSSETERHDLETCEGGYVVLRRLTYGEMLRRRDIGSRLTQDDDDEKKMSVVTSNLKVQQYEFSRAIVEHNLENDDEKPLNFHNMNDVVNLDPRIGGEIETLIAEMNQPPDDDARKSLGDDSP